MLYTAEFQKTSLLKMVIITLEGVDISNFSSFESHKTISL